MQLLCVVDEQSQVWTKFEYLLGLGEDRASGAGLGKREMGAGELKPNSDGQPGKTVIQQRPQTVCTDQRRARIVWSAVVKRDAGRRHVHDRAARVPADAGLLDQRLRGARVMPCLAPGSLIGREQVRIGDDLRR